MELPHSVQTICLPPRIRTRQSIVFCYHSFEITLIASTTSGYNQSLFLFLRLSHILIRGSCSSSSSSQRLEQEVISANLLISINKYSCLICSSICSFIYFLICSWSSST